MPTDILLFGAGGHAKVVYATLCLLRPDARVRIVDDNHECHGARFFGLTIEAPPSGWDGWPALVHVSIGRNAARRAVAERLRGQGRQLLSVIHPAAIVSPHAHVADGAFVAAGAVIGPDANIGVGAIINHGAVVDHDCRIGDYAHVAPNATLGGGVCVGGIAMVGAGAVALQMIEIGEAAVVGAGAVVTRAVAAGATVTGVPARQRP
jgi:sugar O-acyltransferase (sialic acid O-acetyltransferase NeuD family)